MAKGYERFEIEKSHGIRKALILQRLLQAHQKLTGHEWQSHMNATITTAWLARQGLLSLLGKHRRLAGSVPS